MGLRWSPEEPHCCWENKSHICSLLLHCQFQPFPIYKLFPNWLSGQRTTLLCNIVLFNHCVYLCHISLCLQTLTCQEQVNFASLVLHRHKAQWDRGEPPAHPGTAMKITSFKWENTLPESCSTCFIQPQSTKTDSSVSPGSVAMVVPGSLQS